MPDPVAHFQILSQDPEGTSLFYCRTFGWKVQAANHLGYRELDTGTGALGGGVWPAPPGAAAAVQLFIAVDDVPEAVERARANGASVLIPPQTLPDGDEMAVLLDPQGLSFGVMLRALRRERRLT